MHNPRNGLASNIEATEEVLADMPTSDLAKLNGWRRVVGAIRDWLSRVGARNLAGRLDGWLKAGLDEQAQADLFAADLVRAAREWVRNGKNGGSQAGTRLADGLLSEDAAKQEKWLAAEAKARGYRRRRSNRDFSSWRIILGFFGCLAVVFRRSDRVQITMSAALPGVLRYGPFLNPQRGAEHAQAAAYLLACQI